MKEIPRGPQRALLAQIMRLQRDYILDLEGIIATGQSVTPKTMMHKLRRAEEQMKSLERELRPLLNKAYGEAYRDMTRRIAEEIGQTVNWQAIPKEQLERLRLAGLQFMENYTDDVIKQVKTQLNVALLNGEDYQSAYRRIRPIGNARARPSVMIRDQMSRVQQEAIEASYAASGNPQDFHYEWVGPMDERTTDECKDRKKGNPYTWAQVKKLDAHPHIQCRHRWVRIDKETG